VGTAASTISPWATSGQITAPEARYAMAAGFAKSPSSTILTEGGVIEGANPSASISGTSVIVTGHQAVVESASGTFVGTTVANMTVALGANPSSGQSRWDIVYAEITGAADTAAVYSLTSVSGAASASPSKPSVPANTTALFEILTTNTGPGTPNPIYAYTRAPGGIRLVRSGDVRAGSFTGDLRKFSNGQIDVWNGSAWITVTQPATWSSFTPVLTASAGGLVLGASGSAIGRYLVAGKVCHLRYVFRMGGAGFSGGKGTISTTLPPGLTSAATEETQILAKLNACKSTDGTVWRIYNGVAYVFENGSLMTMWFPHADADCSLGPWQIANNAGDAGSGVPAFPGGFVIPGPLVIQGTIEIQ
jgi:hypothetical protein